MVFVKINGKKTTFDENVYCNYTYQEFLDLCYTISTFKQLPKKDRDLKIKEVHGDIKTISQKSAEPRLRQDLADSDIKPKRGNSRAKPTANDGREKLGGEKDNAKVHKQKLREKDEE